MERAPLRDGDRNRKPCSFRSVPHTSRFQDLMCLLELKLIQKQKIVKEGMERHLRHPFVEISVRHLGYRVLSCLGVHWRGQESAKCVEDGRGDYEM